MDVPEESYQGGKWPCHCDGGGNKNLQHAGGLDSQACWEADVQTINQNRDIFRHNFHLLECLLNIMDFSLPNVYESTGIFSVIAPEVRVNYAVIP